MSQPLRQIQELEKRIARLEWLNTKTEQAQAKRILARLPEKRIGEPVHGRLFGW